MRLRGGRLSVKVRQAARIVTRATPRPLGLFVGGEDIATAMDAAPSSANATSRRI
jgi:hypothetical protein